ncbi:esterase family protein [Bacillus sp. EB600]|uniref:alpha/beta hydrolase n=1 Tax=Bacillus sp. EB600 TaxID=2806345 RepID=UPI002109F094|nr:alpha/beta hydrolase-fold protein [Bacillus sp. EB600]MCQ6280937.1 esterase family protein [Bacillus sp. EB600]
MLFPRGTVKELFFQSKELGEELEILIHFPANYSPLFKYSLLIAQDGRDYFQLGRIGRFVDELLYNREIENMIVVGIPYKNIEDRRKKYHPNGEQHQAYGRFLAHELVPFLDKEYPTYQMGSTRALIGDSLGASISLLTALQYPYTFGKVLLQSPLVNDLVINKIKTFTKSELLDIYHVVGDNETEVKTTDGKTSNFLEPNRMLSKLLLEKSCTYFYDEFNGNHSWTYWQPDLERALKLMFHL